MLKLQIFTLNTLIFASVPLFLMRLFLSSLSINIVNMWCWQTVCGYWLICLIIIKFICPEFDKLHTEESIMFMRINLQSDFTSF